MTVVFFVILVTLACSGVTFGRSLDAGRHDATISDFPAPGGKVVIPEKGIQLTVENSSEVSYQAEPVTIGVPLPLSAHVTACDQLALITPEGTMVISQMRILSRWGELDNSGKPIRWLLLDFQADVPAHKSVSYYLVKAKRPLSSPAGMNIRNTATGIDVATGSFSFSIPKNSASLLSQVRLNNTLLKGNDASGGLVITKNGVTYRSDCDRPEVVVEESGPLRSVIRVKGKFRRSDGTTLAGGDARMFIPDQKITPKAENYPITYTMRLTAYKGRSLISLDCTLENNGNTIANYYPVNDIFLDGFALHLPLPMSGQMTVQGNGFTTSLESVQRFLLYQGYMDRSTKFLDSLNFLYQAQVNDTMVARGKRYPGIVDFSGTGAGVMVGIPRFWQNAPKSIVLQNGLLKIGLLPEENAVKETTGPYIHYSQGNYYFSGGWHKTTTLLLQYHGPTGDEGKESARMQARLDSPLVARCDPDWYTATRAFGLVAPAGLEVDDPQAKEAVGIYELYQKMLIDSRSEEKGLDIAMLRDTRVMGLGHYGWENFGDLAFNGAFCSLHYDWPYIMWLQFIRSGDARFRERALEMTEHSADLDQIHTESEGRLYDGIWHWETMGGKFVNNHHKSTQGAGAVISHTWNGGYALGYLLTGNARYREAAERSAEAARKRWAKCIKGDKVVENQTRTQGWSILMLVNLYRITGKKKHLQDALAIFRNSLLYTEQLSNAPGSGGMGYVTSLGDYNKVYQGKVVLTMATYPLEPLCDLHLEARTAGLTCDDLESYLLRTLRWLKEYAYVGGGSDSLLTLSYATDPLDKKANGGGELAHNSLVAGAFGYASMILQDRDPRLSQEYFTFSRQLFRDLMFHRREQKRGKDDIVNPDKRSPVGWGWMPTATKEIGYIGRGGQAYLFAEYERSRKVFQQPAANH